MTCNAARHRNHATPSKSRNVMVKQIKVLLVPLAVRSRDFYLTRPSQGPGQLLARSRAFPELNVTYLHLWYFNDFPPASSTANS